MIKLKLGVTIIALTLFRSLSAFADDVNLKTDPKEDYNPNLLILTGEIRNFMELGTTAKNGGLAADKEKAIVEEMSQTAVRVARVYFQEMTDANRAELNQFLATELKNHADLNNYFVLIGNAFANHAEKLVEQDREHRNSIKVWSTVGGAVLGVALGGGYLYFKSTKAALQTKDYLIAAGALLLGTGVGFGGSLAYTHSIPVDQSVHNASDFVTRYPHGEDFIKELNPANLDLALMKSELEDTE